MEEGVGGGDGGAKPPKSGFTPEYVHDLREENKSWRLKHAESEALLKTEREARKASDDKLLASDATTAEKVKEVQTAGDQRVIRAELKAAAVKAGMVDPAALKMLDLSKVKLGDDGEVIGADELMTAAKKAHPYLFGTQSSSSTHGAPNPGDQKVKKVSEMTDAERKADAKRLGITGPM